MEQEQLIEKLKEIGINTTNCYSKSSFRGVDDGIFVGFFKRELDDDFYFYNNFDKKIYLLPKPKDVEVYRKEEHLGKTKYIVPLNTCQVMWEDKPYEPLPDKAFKEMTLREYACVHLRVPKSGTPWLDSLISSSEGSSIRDI